MAHRRDDRWSFRGEWRDPETERRIERRADRYRGSEAHGHPDHYSLGGLHDLDDLSEIRRRYREHRPERDYEPRYGHGPRMARRYGDEHEPRRREERPEFSARRGRGGYRVGGIERAYNQGGYGGRESHEEGYGRGSYDRMLDMTERYYGHAEEDYGRRTAQSPRDRYPDEQYRPEPVGLGRESFSDECDELRALARLRALPEPRQGAQGLSRARMSASARTSASG